jgi:hypothetical protein
VARPATCCVPDVRRHACLVSVRRGGGMGQVAEVGGSVGQAPRQPHLMQ